MVLFFCFTVLPAVTPSTFQAGNDCIEFPGHVSIRYRDHGVNILHSTTQTYATIYTRTHVQKCTQSHVMKTERGMETSSFD